MYSSTDYELLTLLLEKVAYTKVGICICGDEDEELLSRLRRLPSGPRGERRNVALCFLNLRQASFII